MLEQFFLELELINRREVGARTVGSYNRELAGGLNLDSRGRWSLEEGRSWRLV
jgi:hypothetical protein